MITIFYKYVDFIIIIIVVVTITTIRGERSFFDIDGWFVGNYYFAGFLPGLVP